MNDQINSETEIEITDLTWSLYERTKTMDRDDPEAWADVRDMAAVIRELAELARGRFDL